MTMDVYQQIGTRAYLLFYYSGAFNPNSLDALA